MLNKDYKLGSSWKLALMIPLAVIAFFFVSCAEKEGSIAANDPQEEIDEIITYTVDEMPTRMSAHSLYDEQLFYIVQEMPTFNGGDAKEFRRYIAQNLRYPQEAAENGITGKIFIKFVVTKTGELIIPDPEYLAQQESKPLDEVVVRVLAAQDRGPARAAQGIGDEGVLEGSTAIDEQ